MKRVFAVLIPSLVSIRTPLPLLALVVTTATAFAAEPPVTTVLFEDDTVRVYEVRFAPGAEARTIERPFRIVRALNDGTLERFSPDGETETEHWKAGEVRVLQPDVAGTRNVGSADFALYIVALK